MLAAIILAIVLAVAASILLELGKRPFRSTLAWGTQVGLARPAVAAS